MIKSAIQSFSSSELRARRRANLNKEMDREISSGRNCASCVGHCCTFEHNSMQVSPLQALDTYEYLKEKSLITDELIHKMRTCIKHFRLDKEVAGGSKRELRRYYTCPFYSGELHGCGVDRDSKPYGCLAFNPKIKNVSEAGFCTSKVSPLEKQQEEFLAQETIMNQKIKEELNLYWDKLNFPSAIMNLIETLHQKK